VYISLARTIVRYTVCSAASHCPCALSSLRACRAERGRCSTEPGEAAGHPSLRPAGQLSARLYGGNRLAHRGVEILRCTAGSKVMVNSYLNTYQALAVYISLARTIARYTVCCAASHYPCALSSLRACRAERGRCSTQPGEAAGHPSLRPARQPSARLYGGNRLAHRGVEILRCTARSEVMVNSYLNSYQALAVYIVRTIARYTVCSVASHCPCTLSSLRACRACALTLTTFCARLATDGLLETVTLRLFGVDTRTISGSNGDAT